VIAMARDWSSDVCSSDLEVILQPKLVEPPGECKSDYRICTEIAEQLGIGIAFTEGKDEKAWVEYCLGEFRRIRFPELPTLDQFIDQNLGAWTRPITHPEIAFADFRRDPDRFPLNTPSGKVEIYSKQLFDKNNPREIPPIPKYIPERENPCLGEMEESLEREDQTKNAPPKNTSEIISAITQGKYPLQAIGHHTLHRVHSTHDNNDWLGEAFPQRVFINPLDASARGIQDGNDVRVFNDRGEIVLPCRITVRIMPGVVDIPQGAWYKPNLDGVDYGGNVNVLTSHRWTPFAFGSTQQTINVEIEKQINLSRKKSPTRKIGKDDQK
jgi:anaerobic dimethyl sulfoxide reductase subunit A